MDNYIGLPDDAPQQFSNSKGWLLCPSKCILYGQYVEDAKNMIYLYENQPDICFMGIGKTDI